MRQRVGGSHGSYLVFEHACDEVLKARARVCRTVDTLVGPRHIERPSFYGRPCRLGSYPCDVALGVIAGGTQLDIHQTAANCVAEVPDDTAQGLWRDLTGVPFGRARMHTMTNHMAEGLPVLDVAPSHEESTPRVAAVAAGRWRRPVMVLGLDGAYVR